MYLSVQTRREDANGSRLWIPASVTPSAWRHPYQVVYLSTQKCYSEKLIRLGTSTSVNPGFKPKVQCSQDPLPLLPVLGLLQELPKSAQIRPAKAEATKTSRVKNQRNNSPTPNKCPTKTMVLPTKLQLLLRELAIVVAVQLFQHLL